MPTPEDKAREHIDQALEQAGWRVQDYKSADLHAGRGVVLRNFPLVSGHGFADYLLYIDGKAAGVIEAKKEGFPLVGADRVRRSILQQAFSGRLFCLEISDLCDFDSGVANDGSSLGGCSE